VLFKVGQVRPSVIQHRFQVLNQGCRIYSPLGTSVETNDDAETKVYFNEPSINQIKYSCPFNFIQNPPAESGQCIKPNLNWKKLNSLRCKVDCCKPQKHQERNLRYKPPLT